MEEIIAKKYANALIEAYPQKKLEDIYALLSDVSQAFSMDKCKEIIRSPYVSKQDKKAFMLSLLDDNKDMKNFISVLAENDRLDLIPFMTQALSRHFMNLNKKYEAVLYVAEELDSASVKEIADNLSKRLGVVLSITQSIVSVDGIKLVVQDLGVEISFLKERFLARLKHHILKSI